MKKFGKRVLIFVGFLGILYAAYMVFMIPSGYVSKVDLVNGYISNLDSSDVCEKHFNLETETHCESMITLLKDHEVEVTSVAGSGENIILTLTLDGSEIYFEVSFIEVEVTGVKSVFNKIYYLIDFMI